MLNLLFISDSPKADNVKAILQPVLKVIIDVVIDFDHGLKDVFEKRPATVCIQDQIGGVTGESVARHIQMLLGNSAPSFILLNSGTGKARVINGLYEHLVDLVQPDEKIAEDIKSSLRSLLGSQWDKIYIPPKLTPAAVISSVGVSEESRVDADRLVDDFLSDLETAGFTIADDKPEMLVVADREVSGRTADDPESVNLVVEENTTETTESVSVKSTSDELAEMLLAEVAKEAKESALPLVTESVEDNEIVKEPPTLITNPQATALDVISQTSVVTEKVPVKKDVLSPVAPDIKNENVKPVAAPQPPPASEFRVNQDTHQHEEQIPEDLLLAFEENYRSESTFFRRSIVITLLCLFCAAGAWYLVKQKPQLLASLKQYFVPSKSVTPPASVIAPKPAQPLAQPQPVVQPLPSFIPKEGIDAAYGTKNPGWERYIGKDAEFRLFRSAGRIQAVQVLAKGSAVSGSVLKSVMQEFTGSQEYTVTSRAKNAGIRIEKGKVREKGDVIIYRKNGAIKAFVVSIN